MSLLRKELAAAHAALADPSAALVVTGPHYEWLGRPEEARAYSDAAIAHVVKALQGGYKHPRAGRFSPSAMGRCERRIMFGYAGTPALGFDEESAEMADHGTWIHLRWQAEGITMGWMTAAEAWVEDPDLRIGGSMDGVLTDESMFEAKSAAPNVYTRVVMDEKWPKPEAVFQTDTYLMLADRDVASVVYEDRAYGNFHEFRIARNAGRERKVIAVLNRLNALAENDELPPQLADCEIRMGRTYKECPYRKVCHKALTVSQAATVKPGR